MGLDYSQKRLLNMSLRKKKGKHASISPMRRRRGFRQELEIYAFWTGFVSTIVSCAEVIILALKK